MAEKKVTEAGSGWYKVETTVKDGQKEVPLTYTYPGIGIFGEWFASLPEKAPEGSKDDPWTKEKVHTKCFLYAHDLRERASVREAQAAESTVIKRGGVDFDVMKLAPQKLAAAINAAYTFATMTDGEVQAAFKVARRKAVEAHTLVEDTGSGMVKVANGSATAGSTVGSAGARK